MSDAGEVSAFLATVPFFQGMASAELAELASLLRRRELSDGDLLWRQGDHADGMLVIEAGRVSVSVRLPGGRAREVTVAGRGEVLGEVPLLAGGGRSMTATVVEPGTVLWLSRGDFDALVSGRRPSGFAVRRRIAAVTLGQLRRQLERLSAALGTGASPGVGEVASAAQLEPTGPPDSRFLRRLAVFRAFDDLAFRSLLAAGRYVRCSARRTVIAEGAVPDACYLVVNGAVEKILVRGKGRIRIALGGPGYLFGYESLIDGAPAPSTAAARERALLLQLPREAFTGLFEGETVASHAFVNMVVRELSAALREALRPQALLAASPATPVERP